ncbi:hypothetical protein [Nitrosovibrio tenuis]|uniref:EF-hand domain-containing protein n=1 Tax=Nitrosovibrio tenuis TaxID=1233 RepID=A0A1H7NK48_9PROT|nr:hypothetical protein [Nitrosovibrio tenuis]SEL23754.1 hypothetical protein SAMN05216387_10745 [Nitrosovibrio tenuis]
MTSSHTWNFFRAGGFDQVQIDNGADLLALKELDQKLWVALSCPTRGIEFDTHTLDLIDQDRDAHVHANEILGAIAWAGRLLKNPDLLVNGSDHLALADIDDSTEEGQHVLASAQYILKSLGKSHAAEISLADMADIDKFVAGLEFNGDGVIHPSQVGDASLRATIEDIIKCRGSVLDAGGEAGINQEISDAFFSEVAAYSDWLVRGDDDAHVQFLDEKTQAAADAFHAVKDKVNDYFTRCQLAAYDARAAAPLSRSTEDYEHIAAQNLSAQNPDIANFPLATVEPNKPLPLHTGINPAWQSQIEALREQVIVPVFGEKEVLLPSEWVELRAKFAAFEAWQAAKPACSAEKLGNARLREIARSGHKEAIDRLISQDKAVENEVKAIRSVEQLLRYHRDLFKLVNNFVSFRSFYTRRDKALFQLGTLYLDSRSCDLCVRVDDIAKHAEFANMSGLYLAYCECVRKGGAEKMSIAAAFTDGDSDFLMVGRNGIFYDRKGQDWDATIVRILDHPISIRQAFWSPYKKLIKFINEQLEKLAAARAAAADEKLLKAAAESVKPVAEGAPPPTAPKPPFDVGKFAGIFAAIGLALGAIGGVFASIVSGLLGLRIWEIPLAIIGLMLLISGPAMIVAWFKLKKRTLGPILDANGWAINARARINIPFGKTLTQVAYLPEGSHRSQVDPYADQKPVWPYYVLVAGIVAALIALWYMGIFGERPS